MPLLKKKTWLILGHQKHPRIRLALRGEIKQEDEGPVVDKEVIGSHLIGDQGVEDLDLDQDQEAGLHILKEGSLRMMIRRPIVIILA